MCATCIYSPQQLYILNKSQFNRANFRKYNVVTSHWNMAAVVLGLVVDCIMRYSQWQLDVLNPEFPVLSYSSLWKLRSSGNESKVSPNSLWNSVRTWEYWSADSSCRSTCYHHPKWLLSPPARTRIFSSRNNGVMYRQTRRQRSSFHCTSWWKTKT